MIAGSAPLTGIRVIDLSRLLPGAFATLMLAEMGAEVIKVEDPSGGDPMRHLPPFLNERGVYDLLLNRGKKSLGLDLRRSENAAVLHRLVATADVVVESFRPSTAKRLGVSAAQLRGTFPALVHCSITGYGQSGPYAERAGHDLNYVSLSGAFEADRPKTSELPRMFIADVGGGAMSAVIGILAALVGRGRSGSGQTLDVSMHEAMLYWVMLPAAGELLGDQGRIQSELPTFGAHASYNVYETGDGKRIALGALERKFWVNFCEAIGRTDLAKHHSDEGDQPTLIAEMRQLFLTRTRDEWLQALDGIDACVTPVNSPAEALADQHVIARGVVQRSGGLRAVRPAFLPVVPDLDPAPVVGQHTAEILAEIG